MQPYELFQQLSFEEIRAVCNLVDCGFMISDGQGYILFCNEEYVKITRFNTLGYRAETLVGVHMSQLLGDGKGRGSAALDCLETKKRTIRVFQSPLYNLRLSTAQPFLDDKGEIKFVFTTIQREHELFAHVMESAEYAKAYQDYIRTQEVGDQSGKVIVSSPAMQEIISKIIRVACSDISVLLLGESGVGKDVMASLIHERSLRSDKPYIAVNCGAIPENLNEAELFGYLPGAFTGADKKGRAGVFESANQGTIFLDEIGDLPLQAQVKLLRVLETRQVTRLGAVKPTQTDFRLICATNHNLEEKVRRGEFRQDLFYRINGYVVRIPPLRERKEDIVSLTMKYLSEFNVKYRGEKRISQEVLDLLQGYPWPGNIRQLRSLVEKLVAFSEGSQIEPALARSLLEEPSQGENRRVVEVRELAPLKEAVADVERQLLERVKQVAHSTYQAAEILKVDQSTVQRKLQKYQMEGFR